jgi:hypothetical protein
VANYGFLTNRAYGKAGCRLQRINIQTAIVGAVKHRSSVGWQPGEFGFSHAQSKLVSWYRNCWDGMSVLGIFLVIPTEFCQATKALYYPCFDVVGQESMQFGFVKIQSSNIGLGLWFRGQDSRRFYSLASCPKPRVQASFRLTPHFQRSIPGSEET